MRNQFDKELQQLNGEILRMGGLVEESVEQTLIALRELDADLAKSIIAKDDLVDSMEAKIEKHCLNLFALQQPLARDLRQISSTLKLLTDLERIADHASDISELTLRLVGSPAGTVPANVFKMAEKALGMLRSSLDAFIRQDMEAARRVCQDDDEVDEFFNDIILERVNMIKAHPEKVEVSIDIMFIVKYLERMGDHATNIAEWVIYNVTGLHAHLQHPELHPDRDRLLEEQN
jgi:phosphate transport system protein